VLWNAYNTLRLIFCHYHFLILLTQLTVQTTSSHLLPRCLNCQVTGLSPCLDVLYCPFASCFAFDIPKFSTPVPWMLFCMLLILALYFRDSYYFYINSNSNYFVFNLLPIFHWNFLRTCSYVTLGFILWFLLKTAFLSKLLSLSANAHSDEQQHGNDIFVSDLT
jgi:hypothetical protein